MKKNADRYVTGPLLQHQVFLHYLIVAYLFIFLSNALLSILHPLPFFFTVISATGTVICFYLLRLPKPLYVGPISTLAIFIWVVISAVFACQLPIEMAGAFLLVPVVLIPLFIYPGSHLLLRVSAIFICVLIWIVLKANSRSAHDAASHVEVYWSVLCAMSANAIFFTWMALSKRFSHIRQVSDVLETSQKLKKLLKENDQFCHLLIEKEINLTRAIDAQGQTARAYQQLTEENARLKQRLAELEQQLNLGSEMMSLQEDVLQANRNLQEVANQTVQEAFLEQQKFAAMVDHSTDFIALFDFDGKLMYINRAGKQILGADRELKGSPFSDLLHDNTYLLLLSETLPQLKQYGFWRGELEVCTFKRDAVYTMDASFFTVHDSRNGQPVCHATVLRDITEKKKVSEKLNLLSLVASKTSNAVVITDANGHIEWVNEAFSQISGYQLEEIIGRKPGSFLQGPDTNPDTVKWIRENMRSKKSFSVEILNYHKSGRAYWLEINVSPVLNAYDEVEKFVALEADITERKTTEQQLIYLNQALTQKAKELQKNYSELKNAQKKILATSRKLGEKDREQQKFVSLAESSSDLIFLFDLEGKVIYANPTCLFLLGIDEGHTLRHIRKMLGNSAERPGQLREAVQKLRHGMVWKGVLPVVLPNANRKFDLDTLTFSITDKQSGNPLCVAVVMRDITDKKNVERALHHAYQELRVTSEELRLMNEHLECSKCELETALAREGESRKALEKTLSELKSMQSQLIQAEKMASIGQLTAGIAHEINNPINFVFAGADTLRYSLEDLMQIVSIYEAVSEDPANPQLLAQLQEMQKHHDYETLKEDIMALISDILLGATRTAEIVRGLRNFSRLDEHVMKPACLNECVRSTLILLRGHLKDRIKVQLELTEIPPVPCYPGQVNQVLMNILNNAIQAIGQEGTITIRTFLEHQQAFIQIEDTGCGMEEGVVNRIFDPFFTTKDVGEGTGLGLSVSYGIIRNHGGEISVESTPGKGSAFTIRIPTQSGDPVVRVP